MAWASCTVLRDEIDWARLPAATPDRVTHLLRRCLHRDPTQRLQAIGEARIMLDAADPPPDSGSIATSRQPPASVVRRAAPWVAATLAAVAAALGGLWLGRGPTPTRALTRLSVTLPVPLSPNYEQINVAISRDGRTVAYVGVHNGVRGVYVRALSEPDVRLLAGTENARGPTFSPDGAWLAFIDQSRIRRVPVLGGSTAIVSEGNQDTLSVEWTPDNALIFVRGFTLGLARMPASGGVAEVLMRPDPAKGESSYLWPSPLPGGRTCCS